jgi:small subunit ribosomal protein S18
MKKSFRSKFRPEFPAEFNFDYKDPVTLYRFLTEGGKIVPSRISKLSASQQRAVTRAVKKARNIALLPTGSDQFDAFPRPDSISPKPFEL